MPGGANSQMRSTFACLLIGATLGLSAVCAQSPANEVVVQPAGSTTIPKASAVTPEEGNSTAALKTLQAIKAANDETLQKQAATLSQLEEIEKTADQLRIVSRRS